MNGGSAASAQSRHLLAAGRLAYAARRVANADPGKSPTRYARLLRDLDKAKAEVALNPREGDAA